MNDIILGIEFTNLQDTHLSMKDDGNLVMKYEFEHNSHNLEQMGRFMYLHPNKLINDFGNGSDDRGRTYWFVFAQSELYIKLVD